MIELDSILYESSDSRIDFFSHYDYYLMVLGDYCLRIKRNGPVSEEKWHAMQVIGKVTWFAGISGY